MEKIMADINFQCRPNLRQDMQIEVKNLCKEFLSSGREIRALNRLSFSIPRNEITAIIGPRHAGKSAFLAILGGIAEAKSGQINIDGLQLLELNNEGLSNFRLSNIGFISKEFDLIDDLNVFENVELPLHLKAMSKEARQYRVEDILNLVGLNTVNQHYPKSLSSFERLQILLSRALVNKPQILLCDEPFNGLDEKQERFMHKKLIELQQLFNLTIVIATRDNRLQTLANNSIFLKEGVKVNH